MKTYYTYNTSIGECTLVEEDHFLIEIHYGKETIDGLYQTNDLLDQTFRELEEYFKGQRKEFNIPLQMKGTPFQLKVWEALCTIPYGKTCSYQDIAIQIGNPKAVRAVGMANNRNPIPFIVPCHRVIGKNKKLVGYAYGVELKQRLIEMEKSNE